MVLRPELARTSPTRAALRCCVMLALRCVVRGALNPCDVPVNCRTLLLVSLRKYDHTVPYHLYIVIRYM
jgi:hypothetical protein